ncbi:MAG: 16S rRNA (adenine(1518)-N(6)/adenine(1519)-N(6))-dimethyltransferase RsmA [Planctomycetota bacterium]
MELHKAELLQLFKDRNIFASQTLGQNFLMDTNFLNYIIKTAELSSDDNILEIGSGPGILTRLLAQNSRYVWAVEIDSNLMEISRELYGELSNIKFIRTSILNRKRDGINPDVFDVIDKNASSIKVVSNLPYKTAVPIIMLLLESKLPIKMMLLMVQLEIAQRLTAQTGAHNYSPVSIICHYLAQSKILRKVPPDVFWPKPEVYSSLILLTPIKIFPPDFLKTDYYLLKKLLKLIFSYRRKIIVRALQNAFDNLGIDSQQAGIEKLLSASQIESSLRPQKITPEEYLRLFDNFKSYFGKLLKYEE